MQSSRALVVGGACAVGAIAALMVWSRAPRPPAAPTDAGARTTVTVTDTRDEDQVRAARALIERIAQASHALMPEGFENVHIGMGVGELRERRPQVRLGRPSGRNEVWEETTASGARVVYLAATSVGVVTQVQFLSRLDALDALLPHFQALRRRYGEPTGFWDCPEQPDASPIRRITWRREGASVMEAMLVYSGGVAVTLVVTATGDIPGALARSHCTPVTAQTLSQWPIATELRGERIPFTNAR